jgi:hypothetical protein
MTFAVRFFLSLTLVCAIALAQTPKQTRHSAAFQSMQRKLAYIARNGELVNPDQKPTVITAEEANAYFAEGGVKFPVGVKSVKLRSAPGVITAQTRIDFDEITASRRSMNPLLMVFTGMHDVEIIARASVSGHTGTVKVQQVSIDGLEVPRMALEYFAERYVTPKYPGVALTSRFQMPSRIDVATVGVNSASVAQK